MSDFVKFLVLGDSGVGKSSFVVTAITGKFPIGDPVFGGWSDTIVSKKTENEYRFGFWDCPGSSDYDRLRPLMYPDTKTVVYSFAINDPESFDHIASRWIPEMKRYAVHQLAEQPYCILGLKADIRKSNLTAKVDRQTAKESHKVHSQILDHWQRPDSTIEFPLDLIHLICEFSVYLDNEIKQPEISEDRIKQAMKSKWRYGIHLKSNPPYFEYAAVEPDTLGSLFHTLIEVYEQILDPPASDSKKTCSIM